MIELTPPEGQAPFKHFKLHSGLTVFPNFDQGGKVRVPDEADAQELEKEGWMRTAASRHSKAVETDLLRKSMSTQFMRETGVMPPTPTSGRSPSDGELLRRGLAAGMQREARSIGDADADRKRELGEIEIDLGTGRPRRIRVAHDPQNGALHLHGVAVLTAELDPALARSIRLTAGALKEAQGEEEQATQRELLIALIERVLRRDKFAADAIVRQLDHERFIRQFKKGKDTVTQIDLGNGQSVDRSHVPATMLTAYDQATTALAAAQSNILGWIKPLIALQAPIAFTGSFHCNSVGQSGRVYYVPEPGGALLVDSRDVLVFMNLKPVGFTMVQSGTTAQRPASPRAGLAFNDTTVGSYVRWDGATWNAVTLT